MIYNTGCIKKTEFCQIEHLQILLVIGEKYLWFLWQIQSYHALSRQFQCFYWALGVYSLGGIQGLERGTKEQEVEQKQLVCQHNSNRNQSHYFRLYWLNWICHEKSQYFSSITIRICKCKLAKLSFFETPCTYKLTQAQKGQKQGCAPKNDQ